MRARRDAMATPEKCLGNTIATVASFAHYGGVMQPRLATVAWSSDTHFSHIINSNIVH